MIDQMAKLVAYAKAPAITYQTLHPVQAMRWRLLPFELHYGYGVRLALIAGALVGFPLGIVAGLRMRRGSRGETLREKLERQRTRRGGAGREPTHRMPGSRGAGVPAESVYAGETPPIGRSP